MEVGQSRRELVLVDIEALEAQVVEQNDKLSERCVQFLLQPEAMDPYTQRAEEQQGKVEGVESNLQSKVQSVEGKVDAMAGDLAKIMQLLQPK